MQEAPNPSAQAGNAAHGALRFAVESVSLRAERGKPVSKREFLDRFIYLLSKEPMREIDYREAIKKGEKALSVYFDAHHKTWNSNMKCEYAVAAPLRSSEGAKQGHDIMLHGRLDRIDILDDGRVRVIDYKFKKPMTRNEILGNTKNSDGNYYRQLTFYKLLIDEGTELGLRSPAKHGWKMVEGVLDFLEPDAKGKFHQEVFAPSDAEVSELKQEIIRVTKEILSLEFLKRGCGERDCKYCGLRALFHGL